MGGCAAASGIRFFTDRGLGSVIVPGALRAAGWLLITMDERYGTSDSQRLLDIEWIPEAVAQGDVILCKDLAIARNPLEAQLIYTNDARMFGLADANLSGPKMAEWFLRCEDQIVNAAKRAGRPFVMAVNPSYGLRRVRLHYPPS